MPPALPILLHLLACAGDPSPLDAPMAAPTRPQRVDAPTLPLARTPVDSGSVSFPVTNRPDGEVAPEDWGLAAPLEWVGRHDGADVYRAPLPVHVSLLPTPIKGTHVFGSGAPPGLLVRGPSGPFRFVRLGRGVQAFGFDHDHLYLGLAPGAEPPPPDAVRIRFDRAVGHEDDLNRGTSERTDDAFLARTVTLDATSTTGLYLPAPSAASWSVEVPAGAVFTTRASLLAPAIRTSEASDGARLVAELVADGQVLATTSLDVPSSGWVDLRWDLAAHGGRQAALRLRTETGATATYDHVFLEEPTLYTPTANPRRVVLVFVDTLRPDHLGAYGYARPTTPFLDRWATQAAVFEQARSVAPWTLPSARAALTGHQPESWFDTKNVAERFAAAGWATEAVVANAFLSQPFDMHRGWGRFQYEHLWPADQVSDAALEALARHPDQDLLLLAHYMDPHLPYEEGWSHRFLWAGLSPDGEEPSRARLYDTHLKGAARDAMRDYVVARYDQNIRMVDDELRGVLEAAGPDATVILFSDHGEEFWEHGSFEHGHSFFDEVLRVPFMVRGPGVVPGRYADPVSLLDVTPTALDLAGLELPEAPGLSLVPRMWSEPGAAEALTTRPQAVGRPLYEQDGWGVITGGHKWIDRGGAQTLFDLGADPGELVDRTAELPLAPYPPALASALDREVLQVWRLRPKVRQAKHGFTATISHPAGFREAWKSYDPRGRADDTRVEIVDGAVVVSTPANAVEPPNAVFLVPNGSWDHPGGLELVARAAELPELRAPSALESIAGGPERQVLVDVGDKGWAFLIDTAHVPTRSGVEVSGFHADMEAQLRELGYLDE